MKERGGMGRVEWTRTAPDDVEHVVSMLLCRQNSRATRIRPSRGDGGIDVLVPTDDGTAVYVYQVKSFASNLSAKQKGQAERSFQRLLDFASGRGLQIAGWYLTLPLDPTDENKIWLAAFTNGQAFPCEWRGLGFIEGLAADYPTVIDYYLRDGKERLQAALESLTAVLRMQSRVQGEGEGPLTPAESVEGLVGLHSALNSHDPHFYYDFSVDSTRPRIEDEDRPALVAAVQEGDADRWITYRIFAYCNESVVERPIPLNLRIHVDEDEDGGLRSGLQAFERYGTPLVTPMGSTDFDVDLPGGLGASMQGGSVSIGPASTATSGAYDIRLQILDGTDELLTETIANMEPPTRGTAGRGIRAHGYERARAFEIEILTDLVTNVMNLNLRPTNLTGLPPEPLLPGLRFMREFHAPNKFRVARPFGRASHASIPIPEGASVDPDAGTVYDLVEALAIIQSHTEIQVSVPDLTQFTRAQGRPILLVADLLRGNARTVPWKKVDVHLHPGTSVTDEPVSVVFYETLTVLLGDREIELGYSQVHLPAARFDTSSLISHDDHQDVRMLPLSDAPAVIRYAGAAPVESTSAQ